MMMHDHDDPDHASRRERWRAAREARRAAWHARRAARRARWSQWADPATWGLDPEALKANIHASMANSGMGATGYGGPAEVAALKKKIAEMEELVAKLSQRVIVLEKLVVDDDKRLAAEIEKLRGTDGRDAR